MQWRGCYSNYFDALTGTKQGGVLSPRIFTLYMDELIDRFKRRVVGCHLIDLFVACLLHADDLWLITPTRNAMQELLRVCEEYCLSLNVKKSKVLVFGNTKSDHISNLILNGKSLEFVNEWKYLGVTIVSGKSISFSARPALSSVYRAFNLITPLSKLGELGSEQVCRCFMNYSSHLIFLAVSAK